MYKSINLKLLYNHQFNYDRIAKMLYVIQITVMLSELI